MTIFAEKLATLLQTVRLNAERSMEPVADALRKSRGRTAVAIGSGGSAIMAEYFARCRSTLGHGITIVHTPMDFVVSQDDMSGADVWIFSAGADNPDAVAAVDAALQSAANNVYVMTVNEKGAAAAAAESSSRGRVFVVPVAEPKDGFLATHSLIAMAACVLKAADLLAKSGPPSEAAGRLAMEVQRIVATASDISIDLRPGDTVIVLHDPQCRTLATLIETSLWETAIAPVQRADFRNFAHGRHVWAAKQPDRMLVIAITTANSRHIWTAMRAALPSSVRCFETDLGHAGRLRTAVSIVEGLEIVRALGERAGVDPGKPGAGSFAGAIYGDKGLSELAKALDGAVRHKLEAVQLHDDPACPSRAAKDAREDWIGSIASARIGAVLLDYDGTVVTTEDRFSPPKSELIAEMTRLVRGGIALGFATGRGGSAGTALREALHADLHVGVTVGYYNGGHVRTLDVDIEKDQPASDQDLQELAAWIETRSLLAPGVSLKRGRVQITIKHVDVIAPQTFAADIAAFPAIAAGRIRTVSSHHSFDLLPAATSKTRVTMQMRQAIGNGRVVLAIGDSGEPGGNDADMLALPPSISVQSVCGHLEGSWSLFGRNSSGPAALLRILRALRLESGHARLDLDSLGSSAA